MRDLFVTMAVFGSLPFILKRPYIGVLMWAWIGYMNPHRLSWGFATDFPFAMIVAITTLFGMLFSKETKRIPWTGETIVLLMFIAWMGVTTAFAFHPALAQAQFIKVIKIQLMTFVTMMLMIDRRRIYLLIWVIVLSLGFYGVKGGIFTLLTGGEYHVWGPDGTFIGGNNEIGLALIMTLPLMRYLQLQAKNKVIIIGLWCAMGLSTVAIFGTQSRGAFLGLGAMATWLILKSRKRFMILVLAIIGVVVAVSFMPQSWHDRMETIRTYKQDASAMGRINAWHFAFNLAKDHPILGGGYESFRPDLFAIYAPNPENVHDSHSIYFGVLGEHGFVGLSLFLLLGFLTWRSCSVIAKEMRDIPHTEWLSDLARMVQVSLVGYATSGAFLGLEYFDYYYDLIAIVIVLRKLAAMQREQLVASTNNGNKEFSNNRIHPAIVNTGVKRVNKLA
jgi:probable O-glycosylation ligase (exosortase A-associated)